MSKDLLKILVVEDEALIADHIAMCLEHAGHEIVCICDNGKETLDYLSANRPDLILLDINLNGGIDGVDIANIINAKYHIPFVFLTSNSDSGTVERVKLTHPAGFITKPYTADELRAGVGIAWANVNVIKPPEAGEENSFFIKDKHSLVRIYYNNISHVEAMDNYCVLYTDANKYILPQTLKTVEEKLSRHRFFRVHRSYLVNIDKISEVSPKTVHIGSIEIPISESSRADLLRLIHLL